MDQQQQKPLSKFDRKIAYLSRYNKTFSTETFGVQKQIEYEKNGQPETWRYLDKIDKPVISQVCRAVKNCCIKYMDKHGMPDKIDLDVKTYYKDRITFESLYNPDTPHLNRGIYIDLKACYWEIAYKLGYINRITYAKYWDMKEERNTAIGNLRKRRIRDYFVDGVKRFDLQEVIPNPLHVFNHNIRATAYQYYLDLIHKEGIDSIFFFQTDGYFIFDNSPRKEMSYKARKYFHRNEIDIVAMYADYNNYKDGRLTVELSPLYNNDPTLKEVKIITF